MSDTALGGTIIATIFDTLDAHDSTTHLIAPASASMYCCVVLKAESFGG